MEPVTQPPRRSERTRRPPTRYDFLITDSREVMLINDDEPTTYQEAMSSPESEKWLKAMEA